MSNKKSKGAPAQLIRTPAQADTATRKRVCRIHSRRKDKENIHCTIRDDVSSTPMLSDMEDILLESGRTYSEICRLLQVTGNVPANVNPETSEIIDNQK